jgi:hypothetical protein
LRFVQLKEGCIPEAQAIIGANEEVKEQSQDKKLYTDIIVEASRLKPQYLTQAQHKVLLRLYLASESDKSLVPGSLISKNNSSNPT